jgi:ketosteroid isomerase-like protein
MKRALVGFAITVLALSVSAAAENNRSVEQTIAQLERAWVSAIVDKDVVMLDELLAPEFNGTGPNAVTYSKGIAIADLRSGAYVVEKMSLDEITVNVFGDTAVAFTSQEEKSRYGNQDFSGHFHFTNVWVKRNGNWQVVASHGSRFGMPRFESSELPWGEGEFDLQSH